MQAGRLVRQHWPALLVCACCAGLSAANWIRPNTTLVLAPAAALAVGAAIGRESPRRAVCLGAALILLGLAWGSLRMSALEHSALASRVGEAASARVVVTGTARTTRFATRVPVEVRRFGGAAVREAAMLELGRGRSPPRGAVLEVVRARLVEPRGPETGFDERAWLAGRGIHVVLRADAVRVVGRRGGIGGVADRLRAHVERSLGLGTAGEPRALLRGIVLGDDDRLGDELRDAFRASGLAHLTAVSGQNVAIVAVLVGGIAWLLGLGRFAVHGCAIAGILAYALAVGWEPSVVRAAVAGSVASLAWLASRPSDRWHALALGALVLLLWRPSSLLEPGFQLSFVAVAAILGAVPLGRRVLAGYPIPAKLADVTVVAAACGLATAPILWAHFGAVALWTVPANVAAEPAMPAALSLALLGSALAPVSPEAATTLSWLAGCCAWWLACCARFFAGLPHAQLRSGLVLVGLVGAGVVVLAILRLPPYRRAAACAAVGGLGAVALVGWWVSREPPAWSPPPQGLRVTFLDVGQGDGILLEVRRGAVLVDQGPPEARIALQLRRLGVRALSAVVLTHPQRDHIGGAADVIRRLSVDVVLDPALRARSPYHDAALAAARRRRVPVVMARRGDVFRLGLLRLRVLWPAGPGLPDEDPNRNAVVILASYGATDILLTADAESDVTNALPLRPVEVLKVAHHGSQDAGLDDQLRVLRPQVAVISVGRGNDYGHPHPDTLDTLATSRGLRVLRTDDDGQVVVESDGRRLVVSSQR
ncbi:MAG TPA: ComEC/Rec2 family competence protein [Gaiella sp.]|jgi:competence protein ComEC